MESRLDELSNMLSSTLTHALFPHRVVISAKYAEDHFRQKFVILQFWWHTLPPNVQKDATDIDIDIPHQHRIDMIYDMIAL